MAKKQSLLSRAKAIQPRYRPNWLDRLPDEKRAEVVELLTARATGQIDVSIRAMVDLLAEDGIDVTDDQVTKAVRKRRTTGAKP